MTGMHELGMDGLNALSDDAARQTLLGCCSSSRWADAVAAARPYSSLDALLAESDRAVSAMSQDDLLAALAGHPRIGDRRVIADEIRPSQSAGEHGTGWSRREQAGISSAGESMLGELEDGNAAYERRFGHIYLACATGRSAAGLLGFLRERLSNDPETEWRVVAAELAKINQLRLRKLIGGQR